MKKVCFCMLMTALPLSVLAAPSAPEVPANTESSSRWQLGAGVVVSDHAYLGRGTQVTPFPLINYEGKHVFFRGITGGVHLWRGDGLVFDAIVTTGFSNIKADDFSRADLARRGIDRDALDDRDRSINAGVAMTWKGRAGQLRAEVKADISGNSKGQEYSLEYGYPMQWGSFRIKPMAGATFLSRKVANYYYGIHPDEVRRGVADYQPGGSLVPEAGVSVTRPIGAKWTLMLNAKFRALPDKISNSPLIDGSHGSSVFVGFSRAL